MSPYDEDILINPHDTYIPTNSRKADASAVPKVLFGRTDRRQNTKIGNSSEVDLFSTGTSAVDGRSFNGPTESDFVGVDLTWVKSGGSRRLNLTGTGSVKNIEKQCRSIGEALESLKNH